MRDSRLDRPPRNWPCQAVRYGLALSFSGVAFAFRLGLAPLLADYSCFLLFAPAAMVASWFAGLGPGLVAFLAGLLLGDYFFLEPLWSFGVQGTIEMVQLVSYSLTTLSGIALIEVVRRARNRAQLSAKEAQRQNEELISEIAERSRVQQALERAKAELDGYSKGLEALVSQRTAKLQQTVSDLEGFCYAIAHDLRAPLRSMEGFSRALLDDHRPALDSVGVDYLERISLAALRMDSLIRDLLVYEQLATAKSRSVPVPLEPLIKSVLEDLAGDLEKRPAQLLASRPFPVVQADPEQLQDAIRRLVANALKFSRPGTTPEVHIWAEDKGAHVRLFVRDNGIGIALEHQARIFLPFSRLHAQRAYPGNGIGLACVRRVVERMGGTVGLESVPDQGSTFWLELNKP
jgi:signal transduction histidine kinase